MYDKLSSAKKEELIKKEYEINNKSFRQIAEEYGTYANKVRRDAIKFKIKIKDKSLAQKNALEKGVSTHPTKGQSRPDHIKEKIGNSVMEAWDNLDNNELNVRRDKARKNWENLDDDVKQNILKQANDAVRQASKTGSKLESFLLDKLLSDGYKVDFHKEQSLLNTKLQIDLFLPTLNVAIEVDGLSHFEPVWGQETLKRNIGYDNKKTGLILGKGWVLIRVKQVRDYSRARANLIYSQLSDTLISIKNNFPDTNNRYIEIGD